MLVQTSERAVNNLEEDSKTELSRSQQENTSGPAEINSCCLEQKVQMLTEINISSPIINVEKFTCYISLLEKWVRYFEN